MFNVFARPKPCRILITLRDTETQWHLSKLAKNTDTTYVYVTQLVTNLAKNGLVVIEPKGKKRIVRLTDRGTKIANIINEMKNTIES